MNQPISVLLINKYNLLPPDARDALEASPAIRLVGETGDEATALTLFDHLHPDIILFGLISDRPTDLDIIATLNSHCPPCHILVFSPAMHKPTALAALKNGAQGCLNLDKIEPIEFINAITTVQRGGAVLSPQLTGWVMEALTNERR